MKLFTKSPFPTLVLLASLSLVPAARVAAQILTTLHDFANPPDAEHPIAGLTLSSNTLYGTSVNGGSSGDGTVFSINTNGTDFTILHHFTAGSEGSFPSFGGLIVSGNTLYGTSSGGGATGTVFKVNVDGTGFTNLVTFTNFNPGAEPTGGLALSGNTLYGTTFRGGTANAGQVFSVNTDGSGFTNLFNFTDNTAGFNPYAGLILSGSTLYGTANAGGEQSSSGSVYALNTNGTGFTSLHTFSILSYDPPLGTYTNLDGANPYAGVILSGSTLFGVAYFGGIFGNGTVFSIHSDGSDFSVLYTFSAFDQTSVTNSDGANPVGRLTISGNTLYGTTVHGGPAGNGTAFKVNTDGGGFAALHGFSTVQFGANTDGANPYGGLIVSGNTLYGTSENAGGSGFGTLFSLSLASSEPSIVVSPSGTNIVLTWSTNAAGFSLQSATNLVSSATWNPVFPAPIIVNGQNTVTNPISGTQVFYRLMQ